MVNVTYLLVTDLFIHINSWERRFRRQQLWLCFAVASLAIGLLAYPLQGDEGARWFLRGAGIVMGLIACGATAFTLRIGPFRKESVTHHLHQHPHTVVWVYYQLVQTMPFGVAVEETVTVWFHLTNGRALALRIPEKQVIPLMDQLQLYLPHATFGYSEEKAFLYQADPRLLLNH